MKRKFIPVVVLIAALIATALFSFIAYADDELVWEYDEDTKTLYIEDGTMEDYENSYSAPWNPYILEIENVVVYDEVTAIGNYAFSGASKLTNVELPETLTRIGEYAFASCPLLSEFDLPASLTSIADYSFAYNGVQLKDFTVKAPASSYALHYIMKNNISSDKKINLDVQSVTCGEYNARIYVTGGMMAYYPYTPKYDGTFKFYSTGNHDTRGYIYDSSYNRIAYNDDGGASTNFLVSSIELTAGETYYFGARIMNSSLRGSFPVFIEPVEYTVSGTFYAMNDPSGAASNIVIDEALLDGVETNGTYTRTVTEENTDAVITAGNKEIDYTFSPDADADIVIPMCDMNGDGYVNGRDWAYMKAANSKYKPLFANFL